MTFTEWGLFFLIIQIIHFFGTWKLYVKADRKVWEAAIPIYNAVILMKIINRPKWWVILLFIPIINLLMFPIVWVETCRSFGFHSPKDTILAIITLGLYIYYINYNSNINHIKNRSLKPPTVFEEWFSTIAFAVIAATLVHTYFVQPYTIPTSSLEKTLLVGDFLLVSKFHYGARSPMTTIATPMLHDTIPLIGIKSYLSDSNGDTYKSSWKNMFSLPYMRLPGFQNIKRNDIVVFNWPADSLKTMWGDHSGKFTYKPIDKKTNYVKRCVGIPGDSLAVKQGYVYINGKRTVLPDKAKPEYFFIVDTEGKQFSRASLKRYNVGRERGVENGKYKFNLTDKEAAKLSKNPMVKSIVKSLTPAGNFDASIFPHSPLYPWSIDNYGPIYIPKKGATVTLNSKTIPFYKQIITHYEHNNLTVNGKTIFINGKKTDKYTFKQNYYWMMGDNRQYSLDARYWGYVPFDHIVGKPVFIWLSWNPNSPNFISKLKSIRWNRMFTTIGGSGKPVSYFPYFLIFLVLFFGFQFYKKRKKSKS